MAASAGPPPTSQKTVLPESLTTLTPPPDAFHLDQFKNGIFVDKRPLTTNRLIFGRAPDCDVMLEHPSISRYHAALLWSPKNDEHYQNGTNTESFWYLIDCGSTHGTVCNKAKMDAGKMIKLSPNNNVVKFGASTRFFTLSSQFESEDDSYENDQSVNNRQESRKSEELENDNGISWGMQLTDCNDEVEETGDSVALKSIISAMKGGEIPETSNKHTYADNPYKCLVQWFEQEGHDVDFKVDTINNKFKCSIELPVDGQWIPIEGSPTNRKKDAIADACLKCCNILDQAQLLFPWQKQNLMKNAKKESYDDEDDILDETVNANKKLKREKDSSVDTYETLNVKWKAINEELCQLKVKLATIGLESGVKPELPGELTDSLDIYLASMNKKKFGLSLNDKIVKSNMRMKIKQLEQEQRKLERLIQITKPSEIKIFSSSTTEAKPDITNIEGSKVQKEKPNQTECESNNQVDISATDKPAAIPKALEEALTDPKVEPAHPPVTSTVDVDQMKPPSSTKAKVSVKAMRKIKQESIIEAIEQEKRLEKRKLHTPIAESDSDYVGWVPPSNQSGDGKTHLNERFGY